ncbi:MAG: hypothetical protein ACP5C4_05260 [Methanomicrobiales archaeon]
MTREIQVSDGTVACTDGRRLPVDRCRFCVHSVRFRVGGAWIPSPARAFCTFSKSTNEVDLSRVEAVACDDRRGEGFLSMMNVIS